MTQRHSRHTISTKSFSNTMTATDQSTKRNSYTEEVNRCCVRTTHRRPDGRTTTRAPARRQNSTEVRPHQHNTQQLQAASPLSLSQTRNLLRNMIAARKSEFPPSRHLVNSRDVGGGIIATSHQSLGRCYVRSNETTLQRIERRLRPGGDADDDLLLFRGGQLTDDRSRALEGPTRQKSMTPSGNRSPKRKDLRLDCGMQHMNDPPYRTRKQLSDGAILRPPKLADQSLRLQHSGNAIYVPTSTVVGSLQRDDAIADLSVPRRESRSPSEFICELVRCHKEASDRCLLGPSKEERERHRAKHQLTANAEATEPGIQLRGKMPSCASDIQTNCSKTDGDAAAWVIGIEPSTPTLVECKTGGEVDGGGSSVEIGQRIDTAEKRPQEEDSVTKNKTASGKQFNPIENYGFEWQRWAKAKERLRCIRQE